MNQAIKATEMAPQHLLNINSLSDLSDKQKELILKRSQGENVVLHTLPGGNICVPTLSEDADAACTLTHVMNGKVGSFYIIQCLRKKFKS